MISRGRVVGARLLAPRVRNLTIASDEAVEPAHDVLLHLPTGEGRRYSVWRHEGTTFDLCINLHGRGPGSRWAESCAIGDSIDYERSRAPSMALDLNAAAHVFLGDETSIASAEALIRNVERATSVRLRFEIPSEASRWPDDLLERSGSVTWLFRSGRPGARLLEELKRDPPALPERAALYVTGDAWLCAMVHRHWVHELRRPPALVRALPFWRWRSA
jgi:NADPH-dependent ferric siderophore reductase